MTKKQLYKSDSIYLTEHRGEGRTESRYVRLIADDGMAITNGDTVTVCVDVLRTDTDRWTDCDLPPEEEEILGIDYGN